LVTPNLDEQIKGAPKTRWRFLIDRVTGAVSTGGVAFAQEDGTPFAHMTGASAPQTVVVLFRCGLIWPAHNPRGAVGERLVVHGNAQRYFAHLRTSGTLCLGKTIRQASMSRKAGARPTCHEMVSQTRAYYCAAWPAQPTLAQSLPSPVDGITTHKSTCARSVSIEAAKRCAVANACGIKPGRHML
jgi:hypothetical protein